MGDLPREEDLTDAERARMKEVQEAALHSTANDWDTIRAKIDVGASFKASTSISDEDWASSMVAVMNERKKYYAQQRFQRQQSRPLTPAKQRDYMCMYLKNQGTLILTELKGYV